MGRDANGFSHTESLSCDACHSGWMPNCYGCHITVDMQSVQRSLISGSNRPPCLINFMDWIEQKKFLHIVVDVQKRRYKTNT